MLRYFFAIFFLIVCVVVALAGFRGSKSALPPIEIFPDMDHQPKYQPQHPSGFFADGRSSRKPVEGTVPMGYTVAGSFYQTTARNLPTGGTFSNLPDYYNTGRLGEFYGDGVPVEVTMKLLDRGEERYNINCAICHGRTGKGNGIVQQIGNWATVANLQDERIRTMPDGYLFSVITNGKNTMGAYGPQIAVEDRWAIVAYLRALQRSQNATVAELPQTAQQEPPANQ
jgi:mono/diheme cytochrome c family protein